MLRVALGIESMFADVVNRLFYVQLRGDAAAWEGTQAYRDAVDVVANSQSGTYIWNRAPAAGSFLIAPYVKVSAGTVTMECGADYSIWMEVHGNAGWLRRQRIDLMGFIADDRNTKLVPVDEGGPTYEGQPTYPEFDVVWEGDDPDAAWDFMGNLDEPEHYSLHGWSVKELANPELIGEQPEPEAQAELDVTREMETEQQTRELP